MLLEIIFIYFLNVPSERLNAWKILRMERCTFVFFFLFIDIRNCSKFFSLSIIICKSIDENIGKIDID